MSGELEKRTPDPDGEVILEGVIVSGPPVDWANVEIIIGPSDFYMDPSDFYMDELRKIYESARDDNEPPWPFR